MKSNYEYYCPICKRLRLVIRNDKPTHCIQCKSPDIEVESPGSERLTKLRYGDDDPSGAITAILYPDNSIAAIIDPDAPIPADIKIRTKTTEKPPKPNS